MQIVALVYVSASELVKTIPDFSYDWVDEDNIRFNKLLHDLGVSLEYPVQLQENIQHRNRFNEVVTCHRWVGLERLDDDWIESGYASKAVCDKKRGSKILTELYAMRGEAESGEGL